MSNNDLFFDPLTPQDDDSLEIAADIYSTANLLPLNKKEQDQNGNNGNGNSAASSAKSNSESIAQVMNNTSKVSICPCCNQADCDTSLTQNQIFVEVRADQDPIFLTREEVLGREPDEEEGESPEKNEKPREFSKEEIENGIMKVVFEQKYDPGYFGN